MCAVISIVLWNKDNSGSAGFLTCHTQTVPNRSIDCNGVHWASVIVSAILPDKIALQVKPFCLGFLMDRA